MIKIAYMLDVFPVISETFILDEIIELRKRGLDIVIFSLHPADRLPYNFLVHAESEDLIKETRYLDPFDIKIGRSKKALLHLLILARYPFLYLKTLRFALRKGGEIFQAFKTIPFYIRQVRSENPNHIHAHFAETALDLSMLISMVTGIPYSFSAHAHDIYERNAKDMRDHIRSAAFMITCTTYNQKYLVEKYGKSMENKIYLNYHGVDTYKFMPAKRQSSDHISILSIGRFVEKKGFPCLIEAIALLRSSLAITPSVTIVGEGPQRRVLEQLVQEHSLDSFITFKGYLTMEEIKRHYGQADIFVLPSVIAENGDRDGIPNVILEAMSSGLSVVSTNVSAIPEVITHGVDGLLVPPYDSKALARAIHKLCQDDNLRKKLGENARMKMIRCFDKTDHIDKLLQRLNPK